MYTSSRQIEKERNRQRQLVAGIPTPLDPKSNNKQAVKKVVLYACIEQCFLVSEIKDQDSNSRVDQHVLVQLQAASVNGLRIEKKGFNSF